MGGSCWWWRDGCRRTRSYRTGRSKPLIISLLAGQQCSSTNPAQAWNVAQTFIVTATISYSILLNCDAGGYPTTLAIPSVSVAVDDDETPGRHHRRGPGDAGGGCQPARPHRGQRHGADGGLVGAPGHAADADRDGDAHERRRGRRDHRRHRQRTMDVQNTPSPSPRPTGTPPSRRPPAPRTTRPSIVLFATILGVPEAAGATYEGTGLTGNFRCLPTLAVRVPAITPHRQAPVRGFKLQKWQKMVWCAATEPRRSANRHFRELAP